MIRRGKAGAVTKLSLVLVVCIFIAPLGEAQQAGKVSRLGILGNVPLTDAEGMRLWGAFTEELRKLGYVEGQNIIVEHLSTAGRAERAPGLATELVRWKPDVLVVANNTNALAAREATRTIPIVSATLSER